jgi:hypothetical protein
MANIEDLIKKPLIELTIEDIQTLTNELKEARSILNDCVNANAVCNAKDYGTMRSKAYRYLSKK